jgi:hypothetical protein
MRTVQTIAIIGWIAGAVWAADVHPAPSHQRDPAAKGTPAKPGAAATRPAISDAQLEAAIRAKFSKSKAGADKFQVHVQGGVATIEGRTDVVQHKGSATRMAKSAGAIAVKNRIQVSDAAKKKSAANLEQGRRRAQIKRGDARSDPRTASVSH